jgi:phosphoglycerate dehydrogenase-like enzyme
MNKIKPELKLAVTSSSFSKSNQLRNELIRNGFIDVKFNETGLTLFGEELDIFLKDSNAVILGLENCDEQFFKRNKQIKVISKYGVGLNNIDFDAAKKYDVKILHTQGVNKRSVSELVLSYILGINRNVFNSIINMKNGVWNKNGGYELTGKVVGIIGFGNIGKDIASLLKPFNVKCLAYDICSFKENTEFYSVKKVELDYLLMHSDIVTLHVPYTEMTHDLISERELELIKRDATLINTSRGGVVNEFFLLKKLNESEYFHAAIDTFVIEPQISTELVKHPRLFSTPHIGGNSREAIKAMGYAAINNLLDYKNR